MQKKIDTLDIRSKNTGLKVNIGETKGMGVNSKATYIHLQGTQDGSKDEAAEAFEYLRAKVIKDGEGEGGCQG